MIDKIRNVIGYMVWSVVLWLCYDGFREWCIKCEDEGD